MYPWVGQIVRSRGVFSADERGLQFRQARLGFSILCCMALFLSSLSAQPSSTNGKTQVPTQASDGKPELPGKVEVQPAAKDDKIEQRITDILNTTGWFGDPQVAVQEGIVFLKGTAENDESKQWAGNLAKNTEGVVAVVNQIDVAPSTIWNFDPAFQVLNDIQILQRRPPFLSPKRFRRRPRPGYKVKLKKSKSKRKSLGLLAKIC